MMNQTPLSFPQSLKQGDTVRIVCTARSVVLSEILKAAEWIENIGFKVEYGKTIGSVDHQFGGTDNERAEDLQNAINDPHVKAIWCARGGYGTARILDMIDFSALKKNPKWIIGFSDITALHAALYNEGLISMHAPMPINVNDTKENGASLKLMFSYLTGKYESIQWCKSDKDVQGIAKGNIVGGNLSVIYSLRGTKYDIDTTDTILLLEDIDEYLYHIDRMCVNFHIGGKFKNLAALISGQFTKMNDNTINFGMTANEIIERYSNINQINVRAFDAPFGHIDYNLPFLHGASATIEVGKEKVKLSYNG
ncbi:MAG: S66 peptidase family protein [Salinivirgaceae bacterium]|jgi:muramoyltetrapeptide carboxypeptidase|nr:LD-carboxypeptidase [Bacteroidales bacterium]